MPCSISSQSSEVIEPARSSAQYFQTSLPEPSAVPRHAPRNIGPADMKIAHVDACDTGVVFDISYPGADDQGLWVERKTKTLSFAPWARCPGPHLQVVEFLKSRFGGGSK